MKKISFRHPLVGMIILETPKFTWRVLAFMAVIFFGAASDCACADDPQSATPSEVQEQPAPIKEDEKDAYLAAKQESDSEKRALKLTEFLQKYPKSALMQPEDYALVKRLEDEYDAYYALKRETDLDNRAALLIEFLQEYPGSTLLKKMEPDYAKMLEEFSKEKKYEIVVPLAEQWLKNKPDDSNTYTFLSEATCKLKMYQRCGECLEVIYKTQPSPSLAKEIYASYQKTANLAKQIEWAEKLFSMQPSPSLAKDIYVLYQKTGNLAKQTEWTEKLIIMPEFNDDYNLRYSLVMKYSKDHNLPKAAEYAQLTLKSIDLVKQPDAKTREQLRQLRRACYHVIGSNLMEQRDFAGAISAFKTAVKIEKYDQGYYEIAVCLDYQKKIEEANLYYAMAELMGGVYASKAKARLETLFKALHNGNLVGIDKVYTKAKDQMAQEGH